MKAIIRITLLLFLIALLLFLYQSLMDGSGIDNTSPQMDTNEVEKKDTKNIEEITEDTIRVLKLDIFNTVQGYLDSFNIDGYKGKESAESLLDPFETAVNDSFGNYLDVLENILNDSTEYLLKSWALDEEEQNIQSIIVFKKDSKIKDLCANWKGMERQINFKLRLLENGIKEILDSQKNDFDDKNKIINKILEFFISPDAYIQIILSWKKPKIKKNFKIQTYFENLRDVPQNITVDITWAEEIILSDFEWDEDLEMYKGTAKIKQFYQKSKTVEGMDGQKELMYTDITFKTIDIYLKQYNAVNEKVKKGCEVLFGNVSANEIRPDEEF